MFSIITATYNSELTILNCITSLKQQTYLEFEHIIIDGNSKDQTIAIIQNNKLQNTSISSKPDFGIYDAFTNDNKTLYRG